MNREYSVLFYSKYSQTCKQLIQEIISSGVNFDPYLQKVCVDNENIRDRIQQNDKIEVKTVPIILTVYPDGVVEKFDGEKVFEWCRSIINEEMKIEQEKQMKIQKELEKRQEEIKQQELEKKKNEKKKRRNKRHNKHGKTTIEDLETESDNDEKVDFDRFNNKQPPPTMRANSGNYKQDNELYSGEKVDTGRIENPTANSLQKKTPMSLMDKAAALQQDRDEGQPKNQGFKR